MSAKATETARGHEFDFRTGDIITRIDLPWSIRLGSQSSQRFHEVPVGANVLVLSVEKVEDGLFDKHKITMCVDGVVGWSSEIVQVWASHWALVVRAEEGDGR